MIDRWDALIVGGGPAGLTAAIYMGRFRRRALLIDGGDSRVGWIPRTRNHPGFPGGVVGEDLLARMREQASAYGTPIRAGAVRDIVRLDDGFVVETGTGQEYAGAVILATGVEDRPAPIADMVAAVRRGLIRLCPICDAYEVIGLKVAVLGQGAHGAGEALFVADYSDRVTLLQVGPPQSVDPERRRHLRERGVTVIDSGVRALTSVGEGLCARLDNGAEITFDTVYSALGMTARAGLAERLGAASAEGGCLEVDTHQQTTVPGLFAAGDVVRGLNQISIAQAEGAIAATRIHNRLRGAV